MLRTLNKLLYLTIIIFFLGDIFSRTAIYYNLEFIRYTAIAKAIILISYLIAFTYNFKNYIKIKETKRVFFGILILIMTYIIGQMSMGNTSVLLDFTNKNYLIFIRYLFWPISLLIFYPLIISNDFTDKQLKFYESIFLINVGLILLSFIFGFSLFKTYFNPYRPGYMGVFNTHNQASYAFILFILYYYHTTFYKGKRYVKLLIVLLASLLIGTKKIYLFMCILGCFHILKFKLWKNKLTYLSLFVATLVLGFIYKFHSISFQTFINIYQEKGLITMLSSMRDELLIQTFNNTVKEDWTSLNYIIGGPEFYDSRTEFGFVDLYLFFGVIGLVLYFQIFKLFYATTNKNSFYLVSVIAIGVVVTLAEGFLSSANQPLVFILFTGYFINLSKK